MERPLDFYDLLNVFEIILWVDIFVMCFFGDHKSRFNKICMICEQFLMVAINVMQLPFEVMQGDDCRSTICIILAWAFSTAWMAYRLGTDKKLLKENVSSP